MVLVKTTMSLTQLIEAVKFVAERQEQLGTMLMQQQQHQATNIEFQTENKENYNVNMYRNVMPICGNPTVGRSSRKSSNQRWRQETCLRRRRNQGSRDGLGRGRLPRAPRSR